MIGHCREHTLRAVIVEVTPHACTIKTDISTDMHAHTHKRTTMQTNLTGLSGNGRSRSAKPSHGWLLSDCDQAAACAGR